MSAKKEQLNVTVFTPQHKIRGMLHLVQNSRSLTYSTLKA
jgi:hypothetical protein